MEKGAWGGKCGFVQRAGERTRLGHAGALPAGAAHGIHGLSGRRIAYDPALGKGTAPPGSGGSAGEYGIPASVSFVRAHWVAKRSQWLWNLWGTVSFVLPVVNRDIPDGVVAVGNPCRVLRKITEEDKKKYWRDQA